jgi:hypothetical protein
MGKTWRIAGALARETLLGGRFRILFVLGPGLVFAALAVPALSPEGAARVTASSALRLVSLLTWLFAVFVAAAVAAPDRPPGFDELLRVRPLGRLPVFAGRAWGGLGLLLVFWIVVSLAGWICIAVRSGGSRALQPRARILPRTSPGEGAEVLTSGGAPARFSFTGLSPERFPPGPLRAELRVRFRLADPRSPFLGTPLEVEAENPVTGETRTVRFGRPPSGKPLCFSVPQDLPRPGGRLDVRVRLGPSPFRASIAQGGLALLGRGGSCAGNYVRCVLGIGMLGLFLAVFSAAAAQALSLPVAVFLAAALWIAGEVNPFVGRVAESVLAGMPGGSTPRPGGSGGPLETLYFQGVRAFAAVFPDFGAFNPSREFAQGYRVPWTEVLGLAGRSAAYTAAAFVLGLLATGRFERRKA